VLSLLLAGRRPAYYLLENRAALGKLTDTCLRKADAGVISIELRDAALHAQLDFRDELPPTAMPSVRGLPMSGAAAARHASHRNPPL
jgi:hypothetical protein